MFLDIVYAAAVFDSIATEITTISCFLHKLVLKGGKYLLDKMGKMHFRTAPT